MNLNFVNIVRKLIYDTHVRAAAVCFSVVVYFLMAEKAFSYLPIVWFLMLGIGFMVFLLISKTPPKSQIMQERTVPFIIVETAITTNIMAFLPYLAVLFKENRMLLDNQNNLTREGFIGLFLTLALPFLLWYLYSILYENWNKDKE